MPRPGALRAVALSAALLASASCSATSATTAPSTSTATTATTATSYLDRPDSGASFGSVFEDLHPGEDLAALREKFDVKAFQRRQEVVIKALIAKGFVPVHILAMPRALLEVTELSDPEASRQKARYLAILADKHLAPALSDLAFPTYQGTPIADYGLYMGLLRSVRINMEFSGSLCRGLKSVRYQEADLSGAVPVLVDLAAPTHACR